MPGAFRASSHPLLIGLCKCGPNLCRQRGAAHGHQRVGETSLG